MVSGSLNELADILDKRGHTVISQYKNAGEIINNFNCGKDRPLCNQEEKQRLKQGLS